MSFVRTCDVYPTTKCNCPEGVCRRQQSENEIADKRARAEAELQQFVDDLVNFQFFLRDKGYINDADWTFEDEAIEFTNQTVRYRHETD